MSKLKRSNVWAVAGGKGGVGKSFFSSNLSIDLAQKGHTVVLIDADFGGPNLHTFFGLSASKISISDYIYSSQLLLDDILLPTGFRNLKLASGVSDALDMANPNAIQQNKLQRALKTLNTDYIIVDLGAGTSRYTLDLFLAADKNILVTAPEPTSMENTYRFIKSAIYRKLKSVIRHPEVRKLLERITENRKEENHRTPAKLVDDINRINSDAGETLKYELASFASKLVVNQVRTPSDVKVGFSMKQACMKHFGVDLGYVGFIEYDVSVLQSIRVRKPVILHSPKSIASQSIRKIAQNIRRNFHLVVFPKIGRDDGFRPYS